MADTNVGSYDDKTKFNCLVPDCDYVTPGCDQEIEARDLLTLHINVGHEEQIKSNKINRVNKLIVPEVLDLDPSDHCNEEFNFWWIRFTQYLNECGAVHPIEMY